MGVATVTGPDSGDTKAANEVTCMEQEPWVKAARSLWLLNGRDRRG